LLLDVTELTILLYLAQIIGPNWKLFELYERNERIKSAANLIEDPALQIKEEIACVPNGVNPADFILSQLMSREKLLVGYSQFLRSSGEMDFMVFMAPFTIPNAITSMPTS
jgi:hypothetical protein